MTTISLSLARQISEKAKDVKVVLGRRNND